MKRLPLVLFLSLSSLFIFFACDSEVDEDSDSITHAVVTASDAVNQSTGLSNGWWQTSTFYHIWVKSFAHSSDDGATATEVTDGSIGNFDGITAKLGYIKDTLGCDTIWLSPIFECNYGSSDSSELISTNMHGYDITDYYSVNEKYGTEDDLVQLINAAHAKGMKIIFDFVPNHTSDQNQWFINSKNKKTVDGIDFTSWYLWNSTQLYWDPMGSTSTWYYDSTRKQYYYAPFSSSMPDLNYNNTHVKSEMKNVIRYWLAKGFDGLRADAVIYLMETDSQYTNTSQTHSLLAEFRKELDTFSSPKCMLAETWITNSRSTLNSYFGSTSSPEFNMLLDFDAGNSIYSASDSLLANTITSNLYTGNHSNNCTYGTFLANHDNYHNRLGTQYTASNRQKLVTALSLLRPTTAIIYYGQEIAQADASGYSSSADIRLRYPFDWDSEATQESTSGSVLLLNKACITARTTYPSLTEGSATILSTSDSVASYTLSTSNEKTVLCIFNLSSTASGNITLSGSIPSETTYTRVISETDGTETLTWNSSTITCSSIGAYGYALFVLGSSTETKLN